MNRVVYTKVSSTLLAVEEERQEEVEEAREDGDRL